MARSLGPKGQRKVEKVMREFKEGTLHSGNAGNKRGPEVATRKQAIAIALSEGRKASRERARKS